VQIAVILAPYPFSFTLSPMSRSAILWTLLSLFFLDLAHFAIFAFVAGLLWRLYGYLRTPMPLTVAQIGYSNTLPGILPGKVIGFTIL